SKIASKAGVADGTIYLYFKNKEDILVSVFEEKMGQFIEKTAKCIKEEKNASDKLKVLIKMDVTQFAEKHRIAVVTQLELRKSNEPLRKKINLVLKPYLTLIDSIIQEGMKENVFRENLHLPIVRQMIFGTMDEAVTNWVMQDGKYDLVEQAEEVHDLLTSGISGQ